VSGGTSKNEWEEKVKQVIIRRTLELYKVVEIPDDLYNSIRLDETGDVLNDDLLANHPAPDHGKDDWELDDDDVWVDVQAELNGEPDPTNVR
jgi:hypothetical protein